MKDGGGDRISVTEVQCGGLPGARDSRSGMGAGPGCRKEDACRKRLISGSLSKTWGPPDPTRFTGPGWAQRPWELLHGHPLAC